MKRLTERYTGLEFEIAESLANKPGLFIGLCGNSSSETHTQKGVLALAKFLRRASVKITQWAYKDFK